MRRVMCCVTSIMVVVMLMGFSIGVAEAGQCELPVFDPDNFSPVSTPMDNPYLSMSNSIDHTFVYEAETEDGLIRDYQYFYTPSSSDPHSTILGVDITVVYDVEYQWVEDLGPSGTWVKLEETWDWHAWDYLGNFWYFGEDTKAYIYDDNWNPVPPYFSTEGSWEAGKDVAGLGVYAEPGIILLADPHPGDCVLQEYYEDEAEDMGKVLRLNGNVSDYCDKDCLVTKEFTKLDPGNIEHKYYAQDEFGLGLGLVYIQELKEKTVIFELVDILSSPPPATPPSP